MTDPTDFQHPVRVYWEDTDAGGVVYHAQYLAFMERARSEWMRALGFGQEALREANLCFVVRSMSIDFRQPARLDDGLSVSVRLAQCRGASLVIAQEV
ncbi:MAG: YbgC/FadM family acyl-CoA thioesterase, partial [Xanthomonadaceae bacterium]|nr:YbgC/FadM family acyl-CoA thioesterase [Xanthomonadaceae bacterium]